jgi:hypothetical protein
MGPQTLPGSLLGQQKPQISYWDPINGICPHSWFCSCDGSSKTKCSFLSNNCCLCSGRLSFIVASIKASGAELLLQSDCLGAVLGLLDFIQMPTTETHRCRMWYQIWEITNSYVVVTSCSLIDSGLISDLSLSLNKSGTGRLQPLTIPLAFLRTLSTLTRTNPTVGKLAVDGVPVSNFSVLLPQ